MGITINGYSKAELDQLRHITCNPNSPHYDSIVAEQVKKLCPSWSDKGSHHLKIAQDYMLFVRQKQRKPRQCNYEKEDKLAHWFYSQQNRNSQYFEKITKELANIILLPNKVKDLRGTNFFNLKVQNYVGLNEEGSSLWECKCICSKTVVCTGAILQAGHKKSCGCQQYSNLKQQFCQKGHDTFICGRWKDGHCAKCKKEEHPLKAGGQVRKICKRGHDTSVTGRGSQGHCLVCMREKKHGN